MRHLHTPSFWWLHSLYSTELSLSTIFTTRHLHTPSFWWLHSLYSTKLTFNTIFTTRHLHTPSFWWLHSLYSIAFSFSTILSSYTFILMTSFTTFYWIIIQYNLYHKASSHTFILMILLLKLFMATMTSLELTGVSVFSWLSNKHHKTVMDSLYTQDHKVFVWEWVLRSNKVKMRSNAGS